MGSPAIGSRPLDKTIPEALSELALDLRWSFNHSADHLWERLDPELWELTHNPWIILQTISQEKLESVAADPDFQTLVADLHREKQTAERPGGWFQEAHPRSDLTGVAYFSMEFMLTEGLPIYSGGLGNVAGDQLKSASNLSVPVTGIGLLYQQGYFRQEIDAQGQQQAFYPYNDPGQLPIKPLREPNGEWLRLSTNLPGTKLWIRAWQAQVGRARLYMANNRQPFNVALTITRAGNLFTTHTPVEAGFDRFDPGLIAWYLKNYAEQGLSISLQDVMALGRRDRTDSAEPFNMAYLAVRGSGAVNGVSQLHGQVSRGIFQVLFPRWPEIEEIGRASCRERVERRGVVGS